MEQYWNDQVLTPSNSKDVIMYLRSLNGLIGVGSHANDETGIEATYVQNFTSGRMITVAFMNKYEYEYYSHSQHAYVANAFARTIRIDDFTGFSVGNLVKSYFATFAPSLTASADVLGFMVKQAQYYLPNVFEPQRSVSVARHLAKKLGESSGKSEVMPLNPAIETPHPYAANSQFQNQ